MKAGLILAFSVATLLAASVSASPITYEREGQLQILTAHGNVLEAVYFTMETGIRIYGDNNSLMIVSMSDNEVLMSGRASSGSSRLFRVLGSNILQQITTGENGERRKMEFIVPDSLVDQAKEDIEERKEERLTSQLSGQSETEVQTAEERAFQRLFARPEISLIEPAAKALGRAGVMGYENQGALHFYATAMALVRGQQRQDQDGSGNGATQGSGESVNLYESDGNRFKRFWWRYRWCDYSTSYCLKGDCTRGTSSCYGKCTDWHNCQGRCGPECWWCWWFVCGSCCYHHGCYDHDICCGRHGMLSVDCLIPIFFSCGGYWCFIGDLIGR